MNDLILKIKKTWVTSNIITICMIICIILIFIYSNLLVKKLDIQDIDLTKEKLYSITQSTKDAIKDINQEVTITVFGFENKPATIDLIRKYGKLKSNIKVEVVNAISRPDIAKEYNLENGDSYIIIKSGERTKLLGPNDLERRDFLSLDFYDITEQKITNTIMEATILEVPIVYMLTGHQEYSAELYDFLLVLENELNYLKPLDLLLVEQVPEDCSAIIIATPKEDFKEIEVDKLIEYINKGGNILFLNDGIEGILYPNMQKFLDIFGVAFARGIVLEQDSNKMAFSDNRFIIPNLSPISKVSEKIATSNGKVMLVNSGVLNIVTEDKQLELGIMVEPFMTSSNKAFLREDLENQDTKKLEGEKVGPFILGAKIDKYLNDEKTSSLVIIANNIFTTRVEINIGETKQILSYLYNNMDLSLNAVGALTQREDTITIRKNTGVVTYVPTLTQNKITISIIFIVPAIIIIAGILVGIKRRINK